MKRLKRFDYLEPASLDEAINLLVESGSEARVLAGGTDLIVDLKSGRVSASTVVNLKRIPKLTGITDEGGATRIGALTKVADLEASPLILDRYPALAQAASVLATPPVRAMATIGGNVGRASPASDLGPPLIVHEAIASISGPAGVRDEAVEDLYRGPGETSLGVGDLITAISLPAPRPRSGSCHLKIGGRGGGTDIAVVGVATAISLDQAGTIADARIVLASVAPTPRRACAAEQALIGAAADDQILAEAAHIAAGSCEPISDMRASAAHRLRLAPVLCLRALLGAVDSARRGEAA